MVWDAWSAFAEALAHFGLAYDAGTNKLYAMGGDSTGGGFFDSTNLVDELSVATWPAGTWMPSLPNLILPNRQTNQAGFFRSGQIWSVGGIVGQTFQFLAEVQHRANGGSGCATPTPTPTCTPGGTPGPWTQAAPVGIDHYGGFVDSNGTYAYEGGGYSYTTGNNINQFGRFDPAANMWTPLAPVPDLYNSVASGVYAPNVNKLFVFGGENVATAAVVNTTRIYNIATNTWSTGANMPDTRAFMASGYYNGKIYLVGGYRISNVDPSFGQVWEYDPVANTFNTSRASMPITMGGPGFGIINGHIYIAGGRNIGNTNLNTLYDYDIAANTWTQRHNLPTGINVPGSAVIAGKLWVFGGGSPFVGSEALPKSNKKGVLTPDTTNILQIYDPATNTWTSGPNLNQVRSFAGGTHLGNTAVAIGGYTGSTSTASVEINVTTGGCP